MERFPRGRGGDVRKWSSRDLAVWQWPDSGLPDVPNQLEKLQFSVHGPPRDEPSNVNIQPSLPQTLSSSTSISLIEFELLAILQ